jgi:hypothetical protein
VEAADCAGSAGRLYCDCVGAAESVGVDDCVAVDDCVGAADCVGVDDCVGGAEEPSPTVCEVPFPATAGALSAAGGGVDTASFCCWAGCRCCAANRRVARLKLVSARVRLAWASATALGSDPPNGSARLDSVLMRVADPGPCEARTTVPAMAHRTATATAATRVCRLRSDGASHRWVRAFVRCLRAGCDGGWSIGSWVLVRATVFSSAPRAVSAPTAAAAASAGLRSSTAFGVWTTSGSAGASMTSWTTADSSPQKSGPDPAVSCGPGSRSPAFALAEGPNGTSSSGGPSHSRGRRTTFPASGSAVRSLPPLAS